MFIPVGVLVGWLWKWRGLWFAVGLSFTVEVLQFASQRGLCEIDDVIHNLIGAVVGTGIVMITRSAMKRTEED